MYRHFLALGRLSVMRAGKTYLLIRITYGLQTGLVSACIVACPCALYVLEVMVVMSDILSS